MKKVGRGLTRIWIVFIVLIEFAVLALFAYAFSHGQHVSFFMLDLWMVVIALLGWAIWFAARWIARGFLD